MLELLEDLKEPGNLTLKTNDTDKSDSKKNGHHESRQTV